MVFLWEILSDLVRVEQGWWNKDPDGIWQFVPIIERLSKGMKIREGDGLSAVRTKIMTELHIDETSERVELTYQMPKWMDVDGNVKPVPIHIRTDEDLDMFLFMCADLHDLKLYVVPLPLDMTIDVDDFKVVPVTHGYALAEVVKGSEHDRQAGTESAKCPTNTVDEDIPLTQPERGESSRQAEERRGIELLGVATHATGPQPSPVSVIPTSQSSSEDGEFSDVTPLTRDLFPQFEAAGNNCVKQQFSLQTRLFTRYATLMLRCTCRWHPRQGESKLRG